MRRDYSDYIPTGNKAIDLVAQAIGHASKYKLTIKFIRLSRTYYALLMAGVEILGQEVLPNSHQLTFEGTAILQGPMGQWDNMQIEYATVEETVKAMKQ